MDQTYFDWMRGLSRDLRPYSELVYLNWNDLNIDDRVHARFGPSLPRLVEIKNRYDPGNMFHVPGGVPTST